MKRKPAPKHQAIVDANRRLLETLDNVDQDNPVGSCWACGNGEPGERRTRAHVIAHRHGGSNEPSNFFLLCDLCHAEQPDGLDRDMQVAWLRSRECYTTRILKRHGERMLQLTSDLVAAGVVDEAMAYIRSDEFHATATDACYSPHAAWDAYEAVVRAKFLPSAA